MVGAGRPRELRVRAGTRRYQEWLDLLLQALRVEAEETWRMARYGTPRLKTQLLHRSRCLMEEMTWRLHRANGGGNRCRSPNLPQRRWEWGQLQSGLEVQTSCVSGCWGGVVEMMGGGEEVGTLQTP